jgi:hypothetical protein
MDKITTIIEEDTEAVAGEETVEATVAAEVIIQIMGTMQIIFNNHKRHTRVNSKFNINQIRKYNTRNPQYNTHHHRGKECKW